MTSKTPLKHVKNYPKACLKSITSSLLTTLTLLKHVFNYFIFQNNMFSLVLDMLADRAKDISSLLQSDVNSYINILQFFAKHTELAEVTT